MGDLLSSQGSPFDLLPKPVVSDILKLVCDGSDNHNYCQASKVCREWNSKLKEVVTSCTLSLQLNHIMPSVFVPYLERFPNLTSLQIDTPICFLSQWSEVLGRSCPKLERLKITRAWCGACINAQETRPLISEDDLVVLHRCLPKLRHLSLPGYRGDLGALQCVDNFTDLATLTFTASRIEVTSELTNAGSWHALKAAAGRSCEFIPGVRVQSMEIAYEEGAAKDQARLEKLHIIADNGDGIPLLLDVSGFAFLRELRIDPPLSLLFGFEGCRLLQKFYLSYINRHHWAGISQLELLEELGGCLAEEVTEEDLSCLGQLQFLKTLNLNCHMPKPRFWDVEPRRSLILGTERQNALVLCRVLASFPVGNQLQWLQYPLGWHHPNEGSLTNLSKLSEVSFEKVCRNNVESAFQAFAGPLALKRIRCHDLLNLNSLNSLTPLTTLEALNIERCRNLRELALPPTLSQLTSLRVSACKRLTSVTHLSPSLRSLELSYLPLDTSPPFDHTPLLHSLILCHLKRLHMVPSFAPLQSLRKLTICFLDLHSLPPLTPLPSLLELTVSRCNNLEELPALPPSLLQLKADGCPRVISLPCSNLLFLELVDCQTLRVDNLADHLPCLKHATIIQCPYVSREFAEEEPWQATEADINCYDLLYHGWVFTKC